LLYRLRLSDSHGQLGIRLRSIGAPRAALGALRKCFEIRDAAPREMERPREFRFLGAIYRSEMAYALLSLRRPRDAEPLLRAAIETFNADAADFPRFGGRHQIMASAKGRLAQLLAHGGRPDEAIRLYRESLDNLERAVDLEQSRPSTWLNLLKNSDNLGKLLEASGKLVEAEGARRRSVRYADGFTRGAREHGYVTWAHEIGWPYRSRWNLATLLRQRGAPAEADALVREALALVDAEARRPGIKPDELRLVLRGVVWELTGPDELRLLAETLSRRTPGPAGGDGERPAGLDVRRQQANLLSAHAWACAFDGHHPLAVEALREEARLRKDVAAGRVPPNPEDRLLLALTQA